MGGGHTFIPLPEEHHLKVVGESHYQPALAELARLPGPIREGRKAFPATLIAEPDNPYDANAIAVLGPTGQIGYVARSTAERFAETFRCIHAAGYSGATCGGLLNGGTADRPSYGAVLAISYPEACQEYLSAYL